MKMSYLDVESTGIGENWVLRWSEAYISADCVLVVIGPRWSPERLHQKSDAVLIEVSGGGIWVAWERVIPVLIDGGVLPERAQLPRAMRGLLTRQGYAIDPQAPAESIARFVERLERDKQPPPGWHKRLLRFRSRAPATSFDLTGEWEMQSEQPLFTEICIQQNGKLLNFWALGVYADEITGEGFVAVEGPGVTFILTSKQHGPAGMLILKHDTRSATLTGMPPTRSLWISALYRKKVSLKRKERDATRGSP